VTHGNIPVDMPPVLIRCLSQKEKIMSAVRVNIGTDFDPEHLGSNGPALHPHLPREPGWAAMGVGLPKEFLFGDDHVHICVTIAMLAMQPDPRRAHQYPNALVTLALYAAEAAVTLTQKQFRILERRVKSFMDRVSDFEYVATNNWDYAKYVLDRAVARAQREKLI
jgi:hypothetical protein